MTDERPNIDELVSIDEQIQIVKRARSLIWERESWVQGSWKCKIPDATTPNGGEKYQYCVEGALNQATYDVLGEQRALTLGAVVFDNSTGFLDFKGKEDRDNPASLLGIDELVQDQFGFTRAMEFNDSEPEDEDEDGAHYGNVHKGLIEVLSTRLTQLTRKKEAA